MDIVFERGKIWGIQIIVIVITTTPSLRINPKQSYSTRSTIQIDYTVYKCEWSSIISIPTFFRVSSIKRDSLTVSSVPRWILARMVLWFSPASLHTAEMLKYFCTLCNVSISIITFCTIFIIFAIKLLQYKDNLLYLYKITNNNWDFHARNQFYF